MDQIDERIVVIGLGYVGLPLAIAFATAGVLVVGLEVSEERVANLNQGLSYIDDIDDDRIATVLHAGKFRATTDTSCIEDASAIIICVPTPLTEHRTPDMRAVEEAARTTSRHLRPGHLVVLESTTYPGTTEEVVAPILAASGLGVGRDVDLAFSPERIDPGATGSTGYTLRNTPKVVGGVNATSTERAVRLYGSVVDTVVPVSSCRVAEMTKLFENIFRNVNIALVNELSMLCDHMDLDVWEVIDAAETKPFGFMRFNPGPGVGGHCIPIDPFYLTWKAREYGLHTRFIELAGEVNDAMPRYVADRVIKALNNVRKSLNGARILALGVAYKANISDLRESPAIAVVAELLDGGAEVVIHDPHVHDVTVNGYRLEGASLTAEELRRADCVVLLTDHKDVDYDLVREHATLVIDTRNRLARKDPVTVKAAR